MASSLRFATWHRDMTKRTTANQIPNATNAITTKLTETSSR
jgi:hypothetical protein